MTEWRWFLVCVAGGCAGAVFLYWLTQSHIHPRPAPPPPPIWVTPLPAPTTTHTAHRGDVMGLFSTSTPTAKFTAIGDSVAGRIVEITQQQRTEVIYDQATRTYKSGGPMFWSGGRPVADASTDPRTGQENQPVMDGVVTVDTGAPDENGETRKRIIVKGKAEMASVKQACIAAGVRDVEVGGMFKKTWVSGAGGLAEPRVYEYKYKAPEGAIESAPAPAAQVATSAVRDAAAQLNRAHQSSPVLKQQGIVPPTAAGFKEEIPF